MKPKGRTKEEKKAAWQNKNSKRSVQDDGSGEDVGDIFTDEITDFTNERNEIQRDLIDQPSGSEDEEELFALADENEESDEEIGEWSQRLKQIKFQTKLDKKKPITEGLEKSWGTKRADFYGSGVRRKPKEAESDEDDEWVMEEKEIEKLQKKLDEDMDEDDFLIPTVSQKEVKQKAQNELKIKRNLNAAEKQELKKKLHPEAEPLREELNNCLEELEKLKDLKGWKVESRDTCFMMLGANIAFYLHLIENDEDCRGHPVLKRIVQWKKLAKLYEAIPMEHMDESDGENIEDDSFTNRDEAVHSAKRKRLALEDSGDEEAASDDGGKDMDETLDDGELENRPITYEIEKNKEKKKAAPNNPRVKHREKFRKAKIRRKGQIREPRTEVFKYQGEASGIRAGIIKSRKFK